MQTRWIVISEHDANIPAKPHFRPPAPEGRGGIKARGAAQRNPGNLIPNKTINPRNRAQRDTRLWEIRLREKSRGVGDNPRGEGGNISRENSTLGEAEG